MSLILQASPFRSLAYLRHNQRRQEHLASLGLALAGRRVLELGAGIGDHTTFFLDRGCDVVAVEGRPENCAFFEEAFRDSGYERWRLSLVHGNLESMPIEAGERYDIVYAYGLLYHLQDPERALRLMAARSAGLLLLETCVSFGDERAIHPVTEPTSDVTQAVSGTGCRPTRLWVFETLTSLFEHVYVPFTQPNHEQFPLDWTADPPVDGRLTRAVFVASREPLRSPLLADFLPARQTRAA